MSFLLKSWLILKITRSPLTIGHIDGQREISIFSDVKSEDVSTGDAIFKLNNEVLIPLMKRYPMLTYEFGGQNENDE